MAGRTGVIESVGYPDLHYPDNLLCEWFLQGPRGHYLTITLEDLDIQNTSECASDFVEIREYNASGLRVFSLFVLSFLVMLRNLTQRFLKAFPIGHIVSLLNVQCLLLSALLAERKVNKTFPSNFPAVD